MVPPKVITGICVLVAVVWAASILLSMADQDYSPDPAINAIFGGTIGTALTLGHKNEEKREQDRKAERERRWK